MTGTAQIQMTFVLRQERLNRGLSVRAAAKACEVSAEAFTRTEEGELVRPSTALKIAKYFGVEVTDLLSVGGD